MSASNQPADPHNMQVSLDWRVTGNTPKPHGVLALFEFHATFNWRHLSGTAGSDLMEAITTAANTITDDPAGTLRVEISAHPNRGNGISMSRKLDYDRMQAAQKAMVNALFALGDAPPAANAAPAAARPAAATPAAKP